MYDSRTKRPKLKPTDRRPTVNVTAASDEDSTYDDCVKSPQTIDDMRKMRNRRSHAAQLVLKPYVGKRTPAALIDDYRQHTSEQCNTSDEANTTKNCCITPVDHSASTTSGHSLSVHSGNHSSTVTVQKCEKNQPSHSSDTSHLPKEKLMKLINAIG